MRPCAEKRAGGRPLPNTAAYASERSRPCAKKRTRDRPNPQPHATLCGETCRKTPKSAATCLLVRRNVRPGQLRVSSPGRFESALCAVPGGEVLAGAVRAVA